MFASLSFFFFNYYYWKVICFVLFFGVLIFFLSFHIFQVLFFLGMGAAERTLLKVGFVVPPGEATLVEGPSPFLCPHLSNRLPGSCAKPGLGGGGSGPKGWEYQAWLVVWLGGSWIW